MAAAHEDEPLACREQQYLCVGEERGRADTSIERERRGELGIGLGAAPCCDELGCPTNANVRIVRQGGDPLQDVCRLRQITGGVRDGSVQPARARHQTGPELEELLAAPETRQRHREVEDPCRGSIRRVPGAGQREQFVGVCRRFVSTTRLRMEPGRSTERRVDGLRVAEPAGQL